VVFKNKGFEQDWLELELLTEKEIVAVTLYQFSSELPKKLNSMA
jgi:hypothetical protein